MHSLPKISIVICAMQNQELLKKTLKSITLQSYKDLELIVIQDKKTYKEKLPESEFGGIATIICIESFQTYAQGFNLALDNITGKIVHFINAGDEYAKLALFKVATAFKNNHTNAVFGQSIFVTKDNTETGITNRLFHQDIAKTIAWTRRPEPLAFYRFNAIKGFKFLANLKHWHHADIWHRYILKYGFNGILGINDTLLRFYENLGNKHEEMLEQNTYFYSIAKEQGFELTCIFFTKNLPINKAINLNLNLPHREIGRKILNSYLLLKASQFYGERKKRETHVFINQVDKDKLGKKDNKLRETINFRNKYIPKRILNILSKYS